MKKDALISFKTTQEMRDAIDRLARGGDRSLGMQINKILREWFEGQPPPIFATKPQKSKKA